MRLPGAIAGPRSGDVTFSLVGVLVVVAPGADHPGMGRLAARPGRHARHGAGQRPDAAGGCLAAAQRQAPAAGSRCLPLFVVLACALDAAFGALALRHLAASLLPPSLALAAAAAIALVRARPRAA